MNAIEPPSAEVIIEKMTQAEADNPNRSFYQHVLDATEAVQKETGYLFTVGNFIEILAKHSLNRRS